MLPNILYGINCLQLRTTDVPGIGFPLKTKQRQDQQKENLSPLAIFPYAFLYQIILQLYIHASDPSTMNSSRESSGTDSSVVTNVIIWIEWHWVKSINSRDFLLLPLTSWEFMDKLLNLLHIFPI